MGVIAIDVASKLSEAVKKKTISYMDSTLIDYSTFVALHNCLADQFPLVHQELEKTVVNTYSLLYKWEGKDGRQLPTLFMAHQDVVPVAEGTENDWTYDAFSGEIIDGYVWGRGSLDTKITMIGALEAVEQLLKHGFRPENDIYLAFGHDEEIQGDDGAFKIAKYLEEQGVKLGAVLDEGGIINTGSIQGIDKPVGLIGIAEKGYLDLKLSIEGQGGHASMPPKSTALGQMSQLIHRIEKNQMPMVLSNTTKVFLTNIGPHMKGVNKHIIANLWLFKPIFMKIFSDSNSGNALLRTTTAVTMCQGSNASNVLPLSASATINFRIASWNSVDEVINHVKKLGKGIPFEYELLNHKEPSIVSSTETDFYKTLTKVIEENFEGTIVAPYTVLAATDSVKYERICRNIYRFAPIKVSKEELATIHNSNERISIENIEKCVTFFIEVMKTL